MSVSLIDGHIDREKQTMTDNEVIKALNECLTEPCSIQSFIYAVRNAIDLINRQKEQIESLIAGQETLQKYIAEKDAEIERLKDYPKCVYEYDGDITDYCLKSPCSNYKTADEIKSEAVKEFAERLKSEIVNKPSMFKATKATVDFLNGLTHRQHEILDDIDNLVKEMVGDEE